MTYDLLCHPGFPPQTVESVRVELLRTGSDKLLLTFTVHPYDGVALPDWVTSARADDLWKTTCCELFLAPVGSERYFEFNYSPSTRWAVYSFDSYRSGMQELPLAVDPHVGRGDEDSPYLVEVDQDVSAFPTGELQMNLTAVIEETDGTKSFWALAHPTGDPDFHNRDCFVARLPSASV